MTIADINALSALLEDLQKNYTNPSGDFQLKDPTHGQILLIQVHPLDPGITGYAHPKDGIELDNGIFGSLQLNASTLHELFHHSGYNYGIFSDFTDEGMAKMMEDKVYTSLDNSPLTQYYIRCNDYLGSGIEKSLIDQGYTACLFWTYLTEQYGAVRTEPQIGVDAIRTDLESHDSGSDDIQRTNAALNKLASGTTISDVFMDFIVANYAKDLTGPNTTSKQKYIDDVQLPGVYDPVTLTFDRFMPAGDSVAATDEVQDWSAKYYQIRPDANAPVINIAIHQPKSSSSNLIYDLLVIKNDDIIKDASKFNISAKDFVETVDNDNYDNVIVIVGASDHPAGYRYVFSTGGEASHLNIIWPTGFDPAEVDLTDLNKFQVHLEVLDKEGNVVTGLKPSDFKVNASGNTFDIVTGTEVMGQYWLLIQPKPLAAGTYDLNVSLPSVSISDEEKWAVSFRTVSNSDNVLVIDRSGTMLQPNWQGGLYETPDLTDKIYGAIDAASLYVDSFKPKDMMGLVWFSSDAVTEKALMDVTDSNRSDLLVSLKALDQDAGNAWRRTSIGDGLWNAADELDKSGVAGHDRVIILLSDGLSNEPRSIEEVVCEKGNCKINLTDYNTVIHTVALGSNADRDKMEQLAEDTGGRFEYVIEPHSGDVVNDLADAYRVFAETVLREQRIAAIRDEYDLGATVSYQNYTVNMESGATEATFVVNCNWRAGTGGMPPVLLFDPDGKSVDEKYVDKSHYIFTIPNPKSGPWTIQLLPPGSGEFKRGTGNILIEASVKSKVTLDVFLGIPLEKRVIGIRLPIFAFLTDTKPITGATIDAQINAPELAVPFGEETIRLYDDGKHGDGSANDGVYGGIFSNTFSEGVYDMKITADGVSHIAGSFRREAKIAFNLKGDVDSNGDGVPDGWATEQGLDPSSHDGSQTAGGDPDKDGLTTGEEFKEGTDPLNPDTDDGGEIDGDEVVGGRDPTNPSDDRIHPPTSLRASAGVNSATLTIGFLPEHNRLMIYRAKNETGPWQSFEIMPTDTYLDNGLENDVTYYYKVTGIIQDGGRRESVPTRVVSATPRGDPVPPSGSILINNGEEHTNIEAVSLSIQASPDTVEMKVSNCANLRDANWEKFSNTKLWTLLKGTGLRIVYILFKDKEGNIGPRGSEYDYSTAITPAADSIILREIPGVPGTSGKKKLENFRSCCDCVGVPVFPPSF